VIFGSTSVVLAEENRISDDKSFGSKSLIAEMTTKSLR
jgi:hypothetical protein